MGDLRHRSDELGRFNHHPNPATDFCVEVETILALEFDATHNLDGVKIDDVLKRIDAAMDFRVGGDAHAVRAKQTLREIEARLRPKPAPSDAKLREALRSAQIGFECVMEAAEHEGVDECREIARRAVADVRAALTTDGGDK